MELFLYLSRTFRAVPGRFVVARAPGIGSNGANMFNLISLGMFNKLKSKQDFYSLSRAVSSRFVSDCIFYVECVLRMPLEDFCKFGDLDIVGLKRAASGKFTPQFAYLWRLEYLMEVFWVNSSVKELYPTFSDYLHFYK